MGCGDSKPPPPQQEEKKKEYTFGKDPELMKRRHEFIVKKKQGETIVRQPGKIAGQQFIIADCTDCSIYLFDNIGTISVDACVNCRIYIGPCASSAFIRECKDCTIVAAVQQLRTRDCKRVNLFLFTQTAPIIESSSDMRFGCFQFGYTGLQDQFAAAELSVYENKWAEVFDFTAAGGRHFSLMSQDDERTGGQALEIPAELQASMGVSMDKCPVPVTYSSKRKKLPGETFFIGFGPGHGDTLRELFALVARSNAIKLVRSREFTLDKAQLKRLWTICGTGKQPAAPACCTGFEFVGQGAANVVNGIVSSVATAPACQFSAAGSKAAAAVSFFFVETSEETGHRIG